MRLLETKTVLAELGTWTFIFGGVALCIASCGVKSPPLPPLPVTPQQSDLKHPTASPTPQSTYLPAPALPTIPLTPGIPEHF